jgi:hypothetical protein
VAHICSLVHTFASKIACEDTGDGGNGALVVVWPIAS